MNVRLGCPKLCKDWECIDLRGDPPREVFEWLRAASKLGLQIDEIETKNLLEHLANPGELLKLCHSVLKDEGRITLITDNAEFVPFYLPFWLRHSGIGAHSINKYAIDHCDSVHYMVFTKMHLENLFSVSGFKNITTRRIKFGARLEARAIR